jgi:hypothetical protein
MVGRYHTTLAEKLKTLAFVAGRSRAAGRLMLISALALAASAAEGQQAARVDRSQPLEGRWSVELVLDSASVRNPPATRRVSGELAFGTGSWWGDSDRFGRHSINLGPFFGRMFALPANVTPFGPGDTSMVTEVSGGVTGDSVGIDFLPRIDHGGISLWGRFYGDSASGQWHRRGTDGSGRFVLRRLSKEAVSVAAIPVPGRATASVATAIPETKPKTESKKDRRAAAKAAKIAAKATSTTVAEAGPTSAPTTAAKTSSTTVAAAGPTSAPTTPAKITSTLATPGPTGAPTTAAKSTSTTAAAAGPTGAPVRATTGAPTGAAVTAPPTVATRAPATAPTPSKNPPVVTAMATAPTMTGEESVVVAPRSSTAAKSPTSAAKTASTAASPAARPRVMPRGIPGQPPIDTSVMGSFRVRMFDKASKKYFSTQYQLRLPDGTWMWGNLRSGAGADGWGPVVYQRPGKYEVVVENFVCGDKFWFFANKVLQPVVVRLGEVTDVTIELDLSTAPARPTLDNKSGALCTAGPGTPP